MIGLAIHGYASQRASAAQIYHLIQTDGGTLCPDRVNIIRVGLRRIAAATIIGCYVDGDADVYDFVYSSYVVCVIVSCYEVVNRGDGQSVKDAAYRRP